MYWPTKPTSTAKLSLAGREALLRKAGNVIRRFEEIRARAMRYSTPEFITALASEIPLPLSSAAEQLELEDTPSETVCSQEEVSSAQEELGRKPWDGGEALPEEEQLDDDTATLLSPWTQTVPGMLEIYLDSLDRTDLGTRNTQASHDSVPVAHLGLLHAAVNDTSFFIPTDCLLKLQSSINKAYRYREVLKEGLREARTRSRCNPSRWEREMYPGSPTGVIKSLGCGSPLIEGITTDEEWPADDWSSLNRPGHQSMLRGRARATFARDIGAWCYDDNKRSSKSSVEVRW